MKADHLLADASASGDEKEQSAIEALKKVSEEIKKLRKPTGEKKNPGRTCRAIAAAAEDTLKNGYYFIDPNGGSVSDAIRVWCRFDQENLDRTQTCLVPKQEEYEKQTWFSSRPVNGEVASFADATSEETFSYSTHAGQVKYLQILTSTARQKVTIHCKNVIAVFDAQNSTYESAVTLTSFDEESLEVHGKKAFRYRILNDNCKVRNNQWGSTQVEIRGKGNKIARIPILDIGLKDVAGSNQEFGIELGKACFSN